MLPVFLHDPQAVLDYKFDWSAWLEDGETIIAHQVTGDGVTVDSSSVTDGGTSVTAWVSGGTATVGSRVTCQITTTLGRVDERSMLLYVEDR